MNSLTPHIRNALSVGSEMRYELLKRLSKTTKPPWGGSVVRKYRSVRPSSFVRTPWKGMFASEPGYLHTIWCGLTFSRSGFGRELPAGGADICAITTGQAPFRHRVNVTFEWRNLRSFAIPYSQQWCNNVTEICRIIKSSVNAYVRWIIASKKPRFKGLWPVDWQEVLDLIGREYEELRILYGMATMKIARVQWSRSSWYEIR
jgi:hypothetical protein